MICPIRPRDHPALAGTPPEEGNICKSGYYETRATLRQGVCLLRCAAYIELRLIFGITSVGGGDNGENS